MTLNTYITSPTTNTSNHIADTQNSIKQIVKLRLIITPPLLFKHAHFHTLTIYFLQALYNRDPVL